MQAHRDLVGLRSNSKQPIFKTGGVKITKVTGEKVSIPSKQKEAVKKMESSAYYEAQAEDDFSERIRHLEGGFYRWHMIVSPPGMLMPARHRLHGPVGQQYQGDHRRLGHTRGTTQERVSCAPISHLTATRLSNYIVSFEIASGMLILRDFIQQSVEALKPFSEKYGARDQEAERDVKAVRAALFPSSRTGESQVQGRERCS